MTNFEYKLFGILDSNRDGSFSTQTARRYALTAAGEDLHSLGYRVQNPATLKIKHSHELVNHWVSTGISVSTIKNRMAHLRWLATKTNNRFIKSSNREYGLENRSYISDVNRANDYRPENIERVSHPHVRMSLELQREFGLRREEAIKFSPSFADRQTHIELKTSWTKGGRGRIVEIRTQAQRDVLDKAHKFAGNGNLIPDSDTFATAKRRFDYFTSEAGVGQSHGARHAYAQRRYEELTGYKCKHLGGEARRMLKGERLQKDTLARERISSELGHGRIGIVAIYLGG